MNKTSAKLKEIYEVYIFKVYTEKNMLFNQQKCCQNHIQLINSKTHAVEFVKQVKLYSECF